MDKQILEYLILVPGAKQKDHPIQKIEMNFEAAARTMDQLHGEYPEYDVILYEIGRRELAKFKGVKPKPICPRGCEGKRDGRDIVIRTHTGAVQCSLCGYLGA